jgi:hypothetical protein
MMEVILSFAIGMFGTYTVLDITHGRIQKKREEIIRSMNLKV